MSRSEPGPGGYRCPQCGAGQALQPGTDALVCAHCGHRVRIDAPSRPIHAHDLDEARRRIRRGPAGALVSGGHEVQCRHCGARSVTAEQAHRCPFCDQPVGHDADPAPDAIVPDAVLPFGIAHDDASARLRRWMSSRWFAPRDLARRARRDGVDGVYVPYWAYASRTATRYTGARGQYYWETERSTDRDGRRTTRRVRRTRWWPAGGTVRIDFDDLLVSASKGLPRARLAQLEPWQLDDLRPFDRAYLAGFVAEHYSLDLDEGFREATQRMAHQIEGLVRRDIGGDAQRVHSMDVRHSDVRFKHLLLPVWVSSFRYHDRVFRVVVNARTGAVAGDRPWSVAKLVGFAGAIVALIAAIVVLVMHLRRPAPPAPPPPEPPAEQLASQT